MADVLKATLWWGANPTVVLSDDSAGGACGVTETRRITAAEAHDASDATYEGVQSTDDGVSVNMNAHALADKALTTAPAGGIKFVRVKHRSRNVLTAGPGPVTGSVHPYINGIAVGGDDIVTSSFANYQQDFTTNPLTGLPWTKSIIDSYTFGFLARISSADGTFSTTGEVRVAEFTVEVWGQDVTVAAIPAVAQSSAVDAGTGTITVKDVLDPTAVVVLGSRVDDTSNLVTVRSADSTLNDQSNLTKRTNTGTNSSGTFIRDLGGLQGSTAISGSGVISGVKIHAIVRMSKSNTATLGTFRFGTAMGLKTWTTTPTVYDFDAGLNDTMWEHVETALIATGAFGNAFTWGTGVDSVWANFVSPTWDMRATWTAALGKTAQMEVSEAWIEVQGPVGSQPILIELEHALGLPVKQQSLDSTL